MTPSPEAAPLCLRQRHILVCEDSPTIRMMLVEILESAGCTVDQAGTGYEALALMRRRYQSKQPFDAVLIDLVMPELDGFDTLRRMRGSAWAKDLPALVISSQKDRKSVLACMRFQVAGYVVKPFERERVLAGLAGIFEPDAADPDDDTA